MFRAENLSISFRNKKVIKDFSLTLDEGERKAIVGGNGSGKTTLALLFAGVIPEFVPAHLDGNFSSNLKTGLIMQNPSTQFFSLTVEQELAGLNVKKFAINHLLEKTVFELSEGEKQKVNLVANLLLENELILLDEPLELLDPLESKRFRQLIEKEKEKSFLWFDKNHSFPESFKSFHLDKQQKINFPEKKKSALGEKALEADFSLKKNSFELNNVSLSLREGEKVALIGLNGSGKTTILKALAGVEKITGNVSANGLISFAPQNPTHAFFNETVEAELLNKENARELGIMYLLKKTPNLLSKGQQKIVSIAALNRKGIALLDEPTTWLDNGNRKSVFDFINNSPQPMVIATHDKELLRYCDRVFLIQEGGVKECSSTTANRFFQTGLKA